MRLHSQVEIVFGPVAFVATRPYGGVSTLKTIVLADLANVVIERFSFAFSQYLRCDDRGASVGQEKRGALIGAIQACTQNHGKDP
jgi:hypothetical protein